MRTFKQPFIARGRYDGSQSKEAPCQTDWRTAVNFCLLKDCEPIVSSTIESVRRGSRRVSSILAAFLISLSFSVDASRISILEVIPTESISPEIAGVQGLEYFDGRLWMANGRGTDANMPGRMPTVYSYDQSGGALSSFPLVVFETGVIAQMALMRLRSMARIFGYLGVTKGQYSKSTHNPERYSP
jgi:hypothetical protein